MVLAFEFVDEILNCAFQYTFHGTVSDMLYKVDLIVESVNPTPFWDYLNENYTVCLSNFIFA